MQFRPTIDKEQVLLTNHVIKKAGDVILTYLMTANPFYPAQHCQRKLVSKSRQQSEK